MNESNEHLPLILKLAAYRRTLIMKGISKDKNTNPEYKLKGDTILKALHLYKDKIQPKSISKGLNFMNFIKDPLGLKNFDVETLRKINHEKH
jgi:hypothetical protein